MSGTATYKIIRFSISHTSCYRNVIMMYEKSGDESGNKMKESLGDQLLDFWVIQRAFLSILLGSAVCCAAIENSLTNHESSDHDGANRASSSLSAS